MRLLTNYRILLTIIGMVSTVFVLSGVNASEAVRNSKSSYRLFLDDTSLVSWQKFEADIRAGQYDASSRVFRNVLEYHDARVKRDLPNSMALSGISPKSFVAKQQRRADLAFLSIKSQDSNNLWRMLEKLTVQSFDEDLIWTSCEIAARLSSSKFEIIANKVQRLHPDEKQMLMIIRLKWLKRK